MANTRKIAFVSRRRWTNSTSAFAPLAPPMTLACPALPPPLSAVCDASAGGPYMAG